MQKFYALKYTILLLTILISTSAFTQTGSNYWTDYSTNPNPVAQSSDALIHARKALYLSLDYQSIHEELFSADVVDFIIELPVSTTKFASFHLEQNTLMAPGLNEKFPEVRVFNIVSTSSRSIWGKLEVSPKGLHAMIFQPGKSSFYIDPLLNDNTSEYIAYAKNDFITDKMMNCLVGANPPKKASPTPKDNYNDCELHTYRLALAATGEYTAFQGGSTADAFDAMVTTMNRVNGVYERDFAVTMTMIENTDELIYTNSSTDPYTNGSPGQMINENQSNVDNIIGSENYDIGHVFGTNSGGLAGLGVTCFDGSKARGVTGSAAPVGDPFDIDYVAHEMGHEFGGNHSFNNSCGGNRNDPTAVECGSGTTIMGYAGICPPDIQQHSDDYFHGINMEEIGIQITNNTCQVNTALDNSSPEIAPLPETVYIPISTPFSLSASATDMDGDSLTYCWEQMDAEISNQPPAASSTGGPNFRSVLPTVDSTRFFPNLQSLTNFGPYMWERLPSVARTMKFRLTVRDNHAGGGCTQFQDLNVTTVDGTGPFKVIYPSASGISWNGFDYETVTWDVANTVDAPINAQTVDIFLSTDGGDTYPIQLADDVENLGIYSLQVPNISTTQARIMVVNSDGTFFDISNYNFTITSIDNGFTFLTDSTDYTLCQDASQDIDFSIMDVGDFDEPIDLTITELPPNAMAELSTNQVGIGDTATITIISLSATTPGVYPLTISGTSADFSNDITYSITVVNSDPIAAQPLLPQNDAENVPTEMTLNWEENAGPLELYNVQVADDIDFTSLVASASNLEANSYEISQLLPETTYYWRVSNSTNCGISDYSEVFKFTTYSCGTYIPDDLPIAISDTSVSTISSEITVSQPGVIADINVLNLQGTHTNVTDLSFVLESPDGTEVNLASSICGLNVTIEPNGDITQITLNNPDGDNYESSAPAMFGPNIPSSGVSGIVIPAQDGTAAPDELCEPAVNGGQLNGNIALIDRGNCSFVQKVQNAEDAGAIAVIIVNNIPGQGFFDMSGALNSTSIPSVMISLEDGDELMTLSSSGSQDFNLSFSDQAVLDTISCPATTGETLKPAELLSAFDGENPQGIWTLKVTDNTNENGGSLNGWVLQICLTGEDVGIEETKSSPIRIYPNPVTQMLTIDLNGTNKACSIELYDLLGRVVKTESILGRKRVEMNLSQLTPGVYLIQIHPKNKYSQVYKIVKQ